MTGIFECDPFNLLNVIEERLHNKVLRDVHLSVDNKCWYSNEVKAINDGPILQNAIMLVSGHVKQVK